MKKKYKVLLIIATVIFIIGIGLWLILPYIPRWMGETEAAAFYGYLGDYFTKPFYAVADWFNFADIHPFQIAALCGTAVVTILMLVWFIFIFAKKRYKALLSWVYVLIIWLVTAYVYVHITFCTASGLSPFTSNALFYELLEVGSLASAGSMFPVVHMAVMLCAYIFGLIGFVASVIFYFAELVKTIKYKAPSKKVMAASDDEKVESEGVVNEEETVPQEVIPEESSAPVNAVPQPKVIKGPLIVQYIDTTGGMPQVYQGDPNQPYPYYPPYYPYYPCYPYEQRVPQPQEQGKDEKK